MALCDGPCDMAHWRKAWVRSSCRRSSALGSGGVGAALWERAGKAAKRVLSKKVAASGSASV
jgi:hypothetical protein